eukprot:11717519-Alexandrium_andersonii.AAC.1
MVVDGLPVHVQKVRALQRLRAHVHRDAHGPHASVVLAQMQAELDILNQVADFPLPARPGHDGLDDLRGEAEEPVQSARPAWYEGRESTQPPRRGLTASRRTIH